MKEQLLAFIIAASLVVALGYYIPLGIDRFNDTNFSGVTILDEPKLLEALRYAQQRGVLMGVHGYKHENYSSLTPAEAKEDVEKGIAVFHEAGLVPAAFLFPYVVSASQLPPAVVAAVNSTLRIRLPPLMRTGRVRFGEYTWMWRNLRSASDPQYEAQYKKIMQDMPTTVLLHVLDWNPTTRQFLSTYLQKTNETKITVRVDDIEPNTPAETVRDMTDTVLEYSSVGRLVFAVISAGTWRGGDPTVLGVSVNEIMNFYWVYFLTIALFPFSFFLFWRTISKNRTRTNPLEDPLSDPPLDPPSDPPSDPLPDCLNRDEKPDVSVIVPAYNEEANIAKCVEAVLKQDFEGTIEIIVVNDGSTDRTAEIVSEYPVELINLQTNQGKASALNVGGENAKGGVLVFSDSDSIMADDAVSSLKRCLEAHPEAGAVAGNVFVNQNDGGNNLLKRFQMIEYYTEQEVGRRLQSLNGSVLVCPGPLFAVRREVAEKISFSDRSVVEDADYTVKMLQQAKVVQEPQARVYTNAPGSLKEWFNQRKRWWYGNLQIWRIHKQWAKRNAWMLMTYFGFLTSLSSLAMLLLLPYFFSTYDNIDLVLLRGMAYAVAPLVLFILFTLPLFARNRKLAITLLPYTLIYFTIKMLVMSYIFIRYVFGRGIMIKFGSRRILAK